MQRDERGLCVGCHGLRPPGECCRDKPEHAPRPAEIQSLIERINNRPKAPREGRLAAGLSVECMNPSCDRRTLRGDYCCEACGDSDGMVVLVELHTAQCDFETEARKVYAI